MLVALALAMLAEPPSAALPAITASPCRSTEGEIVVCAPAPDLFGRSRYRLPAAPEGFDVNGVIDSAATERFRLVDVGDTGTGSCSPVGGGGWTGCQVREWRIDELQGKNDRSRKEDRVTIGIGFNRNGK